MEALTPTQIFELVDVAYQTKKQNLQNLAISIQLLPETRLNTNSIRLLHGQSGAIFAEDSGFGFVAAGTGSRSNELVLATRGTASLADLTTDLNFSSTRGPSGHLVHYGFNQTFKSYVTQMAGFIEQATQGRRPTAIHCMGHSLGGALANLNAAALAELGHNVYLYTLASPRVGMLSFAQHLSNKVKPAQIYRVAHPADPVTMVPVFPFMHAPNGMGHIYLEAGGVKVNPFNHTLSTGYTSMNAKSWKQLRTNSLANRGIHQRKTESLLDQVGNGSLLSLENTGGGAMFSYSLFNAITLSLDAILRKVGVNSLITVANFNTGAFTMLDQLCEILARVALFNKQTHLLVLSVVKEMLSFLGRKAYADMALSVSVIRWVVGLYVQALTQMNKLALHQVNRVF